MITSLGTLVLIEKGRRYTAPVSAEGHQDVVFAEAWQEAHTAEIGEGAVVELSVDGGLSPVEFVLIVFAEHADRPDRQHRQSDPGFAHRCRGHELHRE
jgi:hypothetical protein